MNPEVTSALVITVVGVGTVFLALSLLSLFTYAFNKVFAGKSVAEPTVRPPRLEAEFHGSQELNLEAGRRKAAAIAVAITLMEKARGQAVFNPQDTTSRSWRSLNFQRQVPQR